MRADNLNEYKKLSLPRLLYHWLKVNISDRYDKGSFPLKLLLLYPVLVLAIIDAAKEIKSGAGA